MILLKISFFNKNRFRKIYNHYIILNLFINDEFNLYRLLQKIFEKVNFLIHFDRDRTLYIDIDIFKKRDFEVIIYYFKINVNFNKFKVINIKFIFFLSRLFNFVKIRY